MLQTLWFILIAVLWIGFYFLEGFDFGVGMLLTFLGKKDEERRAIINTIGPTWDGNEVWLIAAGGAMFAAFPMWYATMFSGFYLALFLLLVGLIIRGIAFEYRSKDSNPKWRHTFDWMITIGSFMSALLLGVAFANLAKGVPIGPDMNIISSNGIVTVIGLLNPYGILGGLATVTVFLVYGANFLSLKLEGDLRERARAFAWRLWIVAVVAVLLFTATTYFYTDALTKLGQPGITPILAVVALLATLFIRAKQEGVHHDRTANRSNNGHVLPAYVPARDDLQPQPDLVIDHLQFLLLAVHADDHECHRIDLCPGHTGVPGMDLLDVPQANLNR
jgi:cytochrome d ubiquinol oxidase subunit II